MMLSTDERKKTTEILKVNFKSFSSKQLFVLSWWCNNSKYKDYDAIICDGAVRSGKTVCMSISFIAWSFYRFQNSSFALCGKTIRSLIRNVITPIMPILKELGFEYNLKVSSNLLEISLGNITNRFYLFGGRDESSASLIQGMTLCGILFDEVALMPRSFVEQGLARCSVEGSKFWFNCNPENPQHWFYKEWILKHKNKNAVYIKFKMEDNPSLSRKMLKRYKSLYSGNFYKRFVEGEWTALEGLIYPFMDNKMYESPCNKHFTEYAVSCDYGTVNPASFGLWGYSEGVWYRIDEYYYDSRREGMQKTDEEHYLGLCELIGNRKISQIVVDPSAASFIQVINRHSKYRVIPAKNNVTDGIRLTSTALKNKDIVICKNCTDSIREFGLYRWDEGNSKDIPVKENDHAMDDIRYFVTTILNSGSEFFAVALER